MWVDVQPTKIVESQYIKRLILVRGLDIKELIWERSTIKRLPEQTALV